MKTITTWKKNHQFEANHDGNTINIDGDKKHGHGPKALLLSGLAGCSGIDIVDILQKMRVDFSPPAARRCPKLDRQTEHQMPASGPKCGEPFRRQSAKSRFRPLA